MTTSTVDQIADSKSFSVTHVIGGEELAISLGNYDVRDVVVEVIRNEIARITAEHSVEFDPEWSDYINWELGDVVIYDGSEAYGRFNIEVR